jgi:hypothetical protein
MELPFHFWCARKDWHTIVVCHFPSSSILDSLRNVRTVSDEAERPSCPANIDLHHLIAKPGNCKAQGDTVAPAHAALAPETGSRACHMYRRVPATALEIIINLI